MKNISVWFQSCSASAFTVDIDAAKVDGDTAKVTTEAGSHITISGPYNESLKTI